MPNIAIRYAAWPGDDGQPWAYALLTCGHPLLAPLCDYETPGAMACATCAALHTEPFGSSSPLPEPHDPAIDRYSKTELAQLAEALGIALGSFSLRYEEDCLALVAACRMRLSDRTSPGPDAACAVQETSAVGLGGTTTGEATP